MKRWGPWWVGVLLDHAGTVMPAMRAEWVRAMRAEAEHLTPREQLPFALGCVWSSYRERMTDAPTLLAAARWSIMIGLCAATAVCFRTAYMLRAVEPSPLVLTLGLVCMAAAVAFARLGVRRLPAIAMASLAAALLAMLAIGDMNALIGGAMPSSRFYRAILLEQFAGWAALAGLAHILLTVDVRHRTNG